MNILKKCESLIYEYIHVTAWISKNNNSMSQHQEATCVKKQAFLIVLI